MNQQKTSNKSPHKLNALKTLNTINTLSTLNSIEITAIAPTAKVAIVCSEYNVEITSKLLVAAKEHLCVQQVPAAQIEIAQVPGAVEIPLIAKYLALTQRFDAIICLGCVIRGDTDHYDYVCQQVSQGCQQVMLEFKLPVLFGILTTQNLAQAKARAGGRYGNKGAEVAQAALEMIALIKSIQSIKN